MLEKLIFFVVNCFDLLTYPFYWLIQRPWVVLVKRAEKRSTLTFVGSNRVVLKTNFPPHPVEHMYQDSNGTIPSFLEQVCKAYKNRKCFGYRRVLNKFDGTYEGKPVRKISKSSKMETLTYNEAFSKIDNIAIGLICELNIKKGDIVLVIGHTCHEWAIGAFAAIKAGAVVATLSPISPVDVMEYGLKQTHPVVIIVEEDFLDKIMRIMEDNPDIIPPTKVVCMKRGSFESREVYCLDDIEAKGQAMEVIVKLPEIKPTDSALIMYTSGTTAHAKGVIVTHKAILLSSLASIMHQMDLSDKEAYTSLTYLPFFHIIGFMIQLMNFSNGGFTVFGSPLTLTENSPSTVVGEPGDINVARPVFMIAVPLVLIKIKAAIEKKVASRGIAFKKFFDQCVQYKVQWMNKGFSTPILDKLVFSKIRLAFGGCLKSMVCGGAPLPPDVQQFIKAVLCINLTQGYGTTESCGPVCAQHPDTISTSSVGFPTHNQEVMLETWKDGGYVVSDPKGPAGEILLGGPGLAENYFKHDDPYDNVAFFNDKNGKKWFRTGDIGRINLETNTLSIIDRKKQMVKLMNGKYVAIGKVETVLAQSKFVSMVCVFTSSFKNGIVAIIIPDNMELLKKEPESDQLSLLGSGETNEALIIKHWEEEFKSVLQRHEIPKAICLVDGPWTPETGLVTAAMKIKRQKIQEHYKAKVDKLFEQIN